MIKLVFIRIEEISGGEFSNQVKERVYAENKNDDRFCFGSSARIGQELGIDIIPIPIAVDGQGYLEGVDFTPREFYSIMQSAKEIPTTSQISPVTYCEYYYRAYQEGYTDVILVGISSTASATYLRAKDGVELFLITVRMQREKSTFILWIPKPFPLGTAIRSCRQQNEQGRKDSRGHSDIFAGLV